MEIMRKFTEVLSSLKGDLTAGEEWLLRCIYVGGKNDLRMFPVPWTKTMLDKGGEKWSFEFHLFLTDVDTHLYHFLEVLL